MIRFSKIIMSLIVGGAITATTNADNNLNTNSAINISNLTIGAMNGDNPATTFSVNITLNTGRIPPLNKWQFGFYQPLTYDKFDATNSNLAMSICSSNNNCTSLDYLATPITSKDLSAGYTTILGPTTNFPLLPNTTYAIKLLHNNSNYGPIVNFSNSPQSFFIAAGNQFYNLPLTKSQYTFLNYDATSVNQQIVDHNLANWDNSSSVKSAINVIPSPRDVVIGTGTYSLNNNIAIHNLFNQDNRVANFIAQDLSKDLNINASVDNNPSKSGITISSITDPQILNSNPEGYQIIIGPNSIHINVINAVGAFYALQTLRQLWNQSSTLQQMTIVDYPEYKYRGLFLDTARHFFSVKEIKKLIDIAAFNKLNTLHLHLSDDEGFRLALSQYPNLTAIGAKRGYNQNIMASLLIAANLDPTNYDQLVYPDANDVYSGYYTANDIAQLISYANARGMTIIPEIDIPAHARALIKAYPNVFVDPNDKSQYLSVQGYNDNTLPVCLYNSGISNQAKQFTSMVNNMSNSVAKMFSGQATLYAVNNEVSLGGDEAAPTAWSDDSSCTGVWDPLDFLGKEQYFFSLVANANSNLKISGWQQIVLDQNNNVAQYHLQDDQVGHLWIWSTAFTPGSIGIYGAQNAANNNYPTVLSFADQVYLDIRYTPNINEPGFGWSTPFSDTQAALSSALSANQTLDGVTAGMQQNILGIEADLWSENLTTFNHLSYMALPKIAGLAEASWSSPEITTLNGQVDWQDLAQRLGCGNSGFLYTVNKIFGVIYRGYPNGISLELPQNNFCNKN
jgi:hexosaminidase